MTLVLYDKTYQRVWIFNARIHHGMVGLIVFVVARFIAQPWRTATRLGASWLIWHDRHDAPWITDSSEE